MNNKLTTPKAILIGSFMIAVSFLFFPPPAKVNAGTCDESYIINSTVQKILFCLDGASISGGSFSTYCNG